MRVLYILWQFPQISQTYIHTELEALQGLHDCRVIALEPATMPPQRHHPFEQTKSQRRIDEIVAEFRPQVLHTHYMTMAGTVAGMAARYRLPFTVRAHSFDILESTQKGTLNEYCVGILAFPFTRARLEASGIPPHRITDCWPVVNIARFENRGANGDGILNLGAARPKKKFEDFVDLALMMPDHRFTIYPLAYETPQLSAYNASKGSPVHVGQPAQPDEMPAIYKQSRWLVYTGCPKHNSVGWPMAIAEAQASGVGVCMARLRPDLEQYVGDAGILYDSIAELPGIISQPVPEDMRERGFAQARKSDVCGHLHLLTDLWKKAVPH